MKKIRAAVVFFLLFMTLVSCQNIKHANAESRTIVVPDDYTSIQEAIDNANEGDMVFVKAGIYYENLNIKKSLILLGENRDTTIIDGRKTGTVFNVTQNSVKISGFTIQNSSYSLESELAPPPIDAGIILFSNVQSCNITGNCIINNKNGILFFWASFNNVAGNKIISNQNGVSALYSNDNNTFPETKL